MSVARTALARLGRNRVFPRRFPSRLGGAKMLASTEGGLKYLRGSLASVDPGLTGLAERFVRPGMHVWDIGANLGLFTFAAAGLSGTRGSVLAVEPDIWLASVLRRTARANGDHVARVDVLPAAVSRETGIAGFVIARDNRATNALEGSGYAVTMGGVRERQHVPTVTLDQLLGFFPEPGLVKIDVESHELDVLAGASRLLSEVRPIMLVEVGAECRIECAELFKDAGYGLFDETGTNRVDQAGWSTIAIPLT